MDLEIEAAMRRARAYWFVDGFTEMAAGGFFVLLAAILLLRGTAPGPSFPAWFLSVTAEISIAKLAAIVVAVLILWWLKDHFTYPRTGFARGRRVTRGQVLFILRNAVLLLLLPIVGLLLISLLITTPAGVLAAMPAWFPVGVSALWAALCILGGEWLGLRRFRWLAALILVAGLGIGVWQLAAGLPAFSPGVPANLAEPLVVESLRRSLAGLSFLTLAAGVLLILSGVVTFLRYRSENPLAPVEGT